MALPRRVPLHVRDVGRTFAVPGVCLTCERLLGECGAVYNETVTLIEYEHQIPDRGASAVLGIWCTFPNSVTTEVDASLFEDNGYHLFQWLEGRKGFN